jgi:rubrerythrin
MITNALKVSAIAIVVCTSTAAASKQLASTESRQDLLAAMKDEAFDYMKYTLYAEQAHKNGNTGAAAAFERIAVVERDKHFKVHAAYFGLVRSDAENLKDVVYSEEYVAPSGNRQDLVEAMKEEAFEYLKYSLYAEQARKRP